MEYLHPPKSETHHLHGIEEDQRVRSHRPAEQRKLLFSMLLTASMMVVEFIGGLLTNSLALISDAGHMLTHASALFISFIAIRLASRPTRSDKSFGFYRLEILAALFNSFVLVIITFWIFAEAYKRFLNPKPIEGLQMFWVACLGLLVNLVTAVILHGSARDDLNVRSAFFHMMGDTLSSVGVVAGALLIFYTGWLWVDPFLSVAICFLILVWGYRLLKDSCHILLESTPRHIKPEEVAQAILDRIKEVRGIHDIHIWEITSKMYAMTAHVAVSDIRVSESKEILDKINRLVEERFEIGHTNIQFEVAK